MATLGTTSTTTPLPTAGARTTISPKLFLLHLPAPPLVLLQFNLHPLLPNRLVLLHRLLHLPLLPLLPEAEAAEEAEAEEE